MMKILWPEPGTYIVAVSGGVDSVCLLDMLVAHGRYDLVVAHVDHGIRPDSGEDASLVRSIAEKHQLNIVITTLNVTNKSSENDLRQARYDFLYQQLKLHDALGVITAHHADDLLETSIMNVRRGTDRYGAAGGMTREGIIRPLINVSKQELLNYAAEHNLKWHEDSTNTDTRYTRNQIRHDVIPTIDTTQYQRHMIKIGELNGHIDVLLKGRTSIKGNTLHIQKSFLDTASLREVEVLLAYALRQARPGIELSQRRIAEAARQIMLGTHKISFSISATDCIIIDIP